MEVCYNQDTPTTTAIQIKYLWMKGETVIAGPPFLETNDMYSSDFIFLSNGRTGNLLYYFPVNSQTGKS